MPIGSHQSAHMNKDEWLTPPEIIEALGPFDLDPCAPNDAIRPWDTAAKHYSRPWALERCGLASPWFGRVWLNPPYGQETGTWLHRLADHGNGIALIFARTETDMFFKYVWGRASAVLFIQGRLHFYHVDGTRAKANAGAPSVLIAYGQKNAKTLENSGIEGQFLKIRR